jgi:hypothetical protein
MSRKRRSPTTMEKFCKMLDRREQTGDDWDRFMAHGIKNMLERIERLERDTSPHKLAGYDA